MFPKFLFSALGGLELMWRFAVIGTVVAYFTAPTIFGIMIFTASTLTLIKTFAIMGFVFEFVRRFIRSGKVSFTRSSK